MEAYISWFTPPGEHQPGPGTPTDGQVVSVGVTFLSKTGFWERGSEEEEAGEEYEYREDWMSAHTQHRSTPAHTRQLLRGTEQKRAPTQAFAQVGV